MTTEQLIQRLRKEAAEMPAAQGNDARSRLMYLAADRLDKETKK